MTAAALPCCCGIDDRPSVPDARLAWRHKSYCAHSKANSMKDNVTEPSLLWRCGVLMRDGQDWSPMLVRNAVTTPLLLKHFAEMFVNLTDEEWELVQQEAHKLTGADGPPRHVDAFIDDYKADPYARWVLTYFRFPAEKQMHFAPFMKEHKLFCTYDCKRWRVTGASRLGDVWLAKDFDRDTGYDERICVDDCSAWGAMP